MKHSTQYTNKQVSEVVMMHANRSTKEKRFTHLNVFVMCHALPVILIPSLQNHVFERLAAVLCTQQTTQQTGVKQGKQTHNNNNNKNDTIYRELNLVKNDNSKHATHHAHTHGAGYVQLCTESGERVQMRVKAYC